VDTWFGIGVFLLGAGAGALLTAIVYSAQIRRLRSEMQASEHKHHHAA